jgi:uncharacterized protein YaiI (UPF0178 family)
MSQDSTILDRMQTRDLVVTGDIPFAAEVIAKTRDLP